MSHTALRTAYKDIEPYTTKDGSQVRELMHPLLDPRLNLSLAEAIVFPGQRTFRHIHKTSHEIYHVTAGEGLMILDQDRFCVGVGDTIFIPPDTPHQIENIGEGPLKILCCCAPAYSHDDTQLLEPDSE